MYWKKIKGGVVVSCQALENEPIQKFFYHGGEWLWLQKKSGAKLVFAQIQQEDINEIKRIVDLPVIKGLSKERLRWVKSIYYCDRKRSEKNFWRRKAEIVALDATSRKRPTEKQQLSLSE